MISDIVNDMARSIRVEFPGAIYHVVVRGNAHADIFTDDKEREWFIDRLSELCKIHNVRLYLFVLMSNHFHLVFETPNANLSKFMQRLLTGYCLYFNRRHNR
ncbi:MAG: addiction module toxin RelE, partial [Lentisphaerae bacterium]|nr:addiction module toxin RelE [Lentisphaerota bacterium]